MDAGGNSIDRISLRDHLDKVIALKFQALSERIEAENVGRDRAVNLAADELSRRLDILNHAHAQAMEVQQRFLPRELHETTIKDMDKRITYLEKMIWAVAGIAAFFAFAMPLMLRRMF